MKNLRLQLILCLLFFGFAACAGAADLGDQQRYKIISYSLGGDSTDTSSGSVHLGSLLITGFTTDILSDTAYNSSALGLDDTRPIADALSLSADFPATPDLSLHGAIGITAQRWDIAAQTDYNASWEANLGVIYKLFNNLRYEVHFGYMDTGDLFKASPVYSDVESIIMISNKLSMSF